MSITCSYDTRSRTDAVSYGPYANDEMCQAFFYMLPE